MQAPEDHPHESARLAKLYACEVLDTGPEEDFKAITELASLILECPIALVSLVDESRQWFKAKVGLDASETPRSVSFCGHAILASGQTLVVEDARRDPRFHDNPLVTGAPHVTFYAGVPLLVGGLPVGTLCVIDQRPRAPTTRQLMALAQLARQTEVLLEARKTNKELESVVRRHRESEDHLRAVVHSMHDGMVMQTRAGAIVWNNPSACRILGLTEDQLKGRTSFDASQWFCSNQARQNWVSSSKSDSARKRLINWSADFTDIGLPSASRTAEYFEKTAMPGPMMA